MAPKFIYVESSSQAASNGHRNSNADIEDEVWSGTGITELSLRERRRLRRVEDERTQSGSSDVDDRVSFAVEPRKVDVLPATPVIDQLIA
jgi:hypothetical protein